MTARDVLVHFGRWSSSDDEMTLTGGGYSSVVKVQDGESLASLPAGAVRPIGVDPATGLLWICTDDRRATHPEVGWYVSTTGLRDRP